MARLLSKMAVRILRVGVVTALLAVVVPIALAWLLPAHFDAPMVILSGVYAGAFLFLVSFIAYMFLLYFSYRDTEKRSTEMRLRERMKELTSIYEIFDVCRKAHSVEEMQEKLPEKVRSAMLSPDTCFVVVEYADKSSGTYSPRGDVKHEFVAPITVSGSRRGQLRAAYVTEEQILPEERQFLGLVAGIFAQAVERMETAKPKAEQQ